jgi:hypothetical protein
MRILIGLALLTAACDPVFYVRGTVSPAPHPTDSASVTFVSRSDPAPGVTLPSARVRLFGSRAQAGRAVDPCGEQDLSCRLVDSSGSFEFLQRLVLLGRNRYVLWVGAPGYRPLLTEFVPDSLQGRRFDIQLVPISRP